MARNWPTTVCTSGQEVNTWLEPHATRVKDGYLALLAGNGTASPGAQHLWMYITVHVNQSNSGYRQLSTPIQSSTRIPNSAKRTP